MRKTVSILKELNSLVKKKKTTGIIIINPLLEMYKKGLGGHRGGSE